MSSATTLNLAGSALNEVLVYNSKDRGKDITRTWDAANSANMVPVTKILAGVSFSVCSQVTLSNVASHACVAR